MLASRWLLAVAMCASVAGCGGDDDDDPATIPPLPAVSVTPAPNVSPLGAATEAQTAAAKRTFVVAEYAVPAGSGPHDVAPAVDGRIWYTAQRTGKLGLLEPATGKVTEVPLGRGSAPHGVIVGADGAAWVTDAGLNAIVRVDGASLAVTSFPLPANRANAGLNTAVFDSRGVLWFTGNSSGVYGSLNPATGEMNVFDAPRGPGPYGIAATATGVYYASLQGSHIAHIDPATGAATPLDPPTPRQGARRIWADSAGALWVSEWNAGKVARYTPDGSSWKEWQLPGSRPQTYAVFVDDRDDVWLTDFGANAIVRFDPRTEAFESFPLSAAGANVRQLHGRRGEVWGAESGADRLVVIREQ